MNAEFERNLWLELTPRRLVAMPVVLALVFFAASLGAGDDLGAIATVARFLFYGIVVLWGTRAAAETVVGEIQARTWDSQRLSSLTPAQMLWGKLLGGVSFQWYGGFFCLAPILLERMAGHGLRDAFAELLYFLAIGLFSHSMSLLASLVAVQRRTSHSRRDVFLYQSVGLVAAWAVATLWDASYLAGVLQSDYGRGPLEQWSWYGFAVPVQGFYLVSLFLFLGWSLIGNATLLRGELMSQAGPLAWFFFVLFMIFYWMGFAGDLTDGGEGLHTARTSVALLVAGGLTYGALLFEPKDPVLYRRIMASFAHGQLRRALGSLQSWMTAFAVLTVLLIYHVATFKPPLGGLFDVTDKLLPVTVGAYAFLARDIGVFLFFNLGSRMRRGDGLALVTLAAAYFIIPMILRSFSMTSFLPFFVPWPEASHAMIVGAPAAEAVVLWSLAFVRLRSLMGPAAQDHAAAA